jgi:PHD/YefM family antitoxin component YafN of YafNO toxin-antitoxin module
MSEEEIESLSRTLNIESSETRAKKINEISKKITQGIQNT